MSENITELTDKILEKTTPKITATIQDENGTAIPAASLTTLTLTLYNREDSAKTIINSRNAQNVLNANNVTVDSNGLITWSVQPLDTAILGTASSERHRAVFEWTYNSGAKNGKYIIDMTIKNLAKTT